MTFLRDLDGHQALGLCIERLVDYGLPALAQLMMHLCYFSIVKSVCSVVGIAYVSVWTLLPHHKTLLQSLERLENNLLLAVCHI